MCHQDTQGGRFSRLKKKKKTRQDKTEQKTAFADNVDNIRSQQIHLPFCGLSHMFAYIFEKNVVQM